MRKLTVLLLCHLLSLSLHAQCTMSFADLEKFTGMNPDSVSNKISSTAYNLEKETEDNGIKRQHYFCLSNKMKPLAHASQVSVISLQGTIKAITYETDDKAVYNKIVSDLKSNGYKFLKTDTNPLDEETQVSMDHYGMGEKEIVIYEYNFMDVVHYCCTIAFKK